MAFSALHTSVGCNRSPHCLDWGKNNFLIYGAFNSVVVFKLEESRARKVYHTLVCHQKLVTSVRWIKHRKEEELENEFISTSVDSTLIIWSCNEFNKFIPNILSGHTSAVQIADAIYYNDNNDLLLCSASCDSTIRIWTRADAKTMCIQTISFGHGFATEVKFASLPNSKDLLLAAAVNDFTIRLYSQSLEEKFNLLVSLSGHDDWIQGLDFITDNGHLYLASGSQDGHIRIWKTWGKKHPTESSSSTSSKLKVKEIVLTMCSGSTYTMTLESVLPAHGDWIYSVKWHKSASGDLQFLSASMDRSVVLWELITSIDGYLEKATLGEVGGNNTQGFFGGVLSPDGEFIAAHGYNGAIHFWHYCKDSDIWKQKAPFGGHFGPVQDISWDPEGAYLMSCGADQTTRLYAVWTEISDFPMSADLHNWFEIARPQVHGYDMVCLSVLNRFKFVSGADEKILRVFQAPGSFAENLKNLCCIDTSEYMTGSLPEGASVPALGLSNKAVYDRDIVAARNAKNSNRHVKDKFPEFTYIPVLLTEPPNENLLLQNTLWPEVQKLYGHPYEIFTVATDHQGLIIASACKASRVEHAAIMLWDANTLTKIGNLEFHALTVTQLEFSHDDEYLLSVSRDRTWAIFQRIPDNTFAYVKVANLEKNNAVHSRVIWSCSWSHDSLYFATSSRDKKVAVWEKNTDPKGQLFTLASSPLEVTDSATAVTFAPCRNNGRYIVAVGVEKGQIYIYSWGKNSSTMWNLLITLDRENAHHSIVNRLKFAPLRCLLKSGDHQRLLLASCGSDHFVRIYGLDSSICS